MDIYKVPEDRRYWVVRADSGRYFEHFIEHGVIALSHLNFFEPNQNRENLSLIDKDKLKDIFKRYKEASPSEEEKHRVLSHRRQIESFIYEMNVGDWVMTIGHNIVQFGRIVGKPFMKNEPLSIERSGKKRRVISMDMRLRRKVVWGPSIERYRLPFSVLSSLKANQTLFCLDSKWEAIYNTLYPAFIRNETLYLSARINTHEKIKNHYVSSLFRLLDETEVIGKSFAEGNIDFDFEEVFADYVENNKLSITTKAQFHSPGEILNSIPLLGDLLGSLGTNWATYIFFAYGMLFGNKKIGWDGIVDLETRQKFWNMILDRMKKNRAEEVVRELQIELPQSDTKALEDVSKDQT